MGVMNRMQFHRHLENTLFWINKKTILFRGMMVKKRIYAYPPSIATIMGRAESKPFTLSQMAGHGSFVLLAMSYLENDFLNLRLYALSGISLSIVFQYYREIPLWLPIGWNALFLLINASMVALLLRDKNAVDNIPFEQRNLYSNLFLPHAMKPSEFLKLMSIAKRVELNKGEPLISEGQVHRRVFVVQEGSFDVKRSGELIGHVFPEQFAGEMSYLRWHDEKIAMRSLDVEPSEANFDTRASPLSKIQRLLVKFKRQLFPASTLRYLHDEPDFAYTNPDILEDMLGDDGVGDGHELESDDGAVGSASVVCSDKAVVYSWTFSELHEFYLDDPKASIILEMCMSADLNNKFLDQSASDLARKYNQILCGALLATELSPAVKEKLELKRLEMGVASGDHERMLHELGWTIEEFATGKKRVALQLASACHQ